VLGENRSVSARVAWITIAPVKGLALVEREQASLDERGVHDDRRFHLIDEQGLLVNGKRFGRLVQVVPDWNETDGVLRLTLPEGRQLEGAIDLGEPVSTIFYGRPVPGRVVNGPFGKALSELVGERLRFIRSDEPGDGVDRGSGGAVTILGAASLDRLAKVAGVESVDRRRFRMLFGIDGIAAHEEDTWIGRRVSLGEAVVEPLGNVGRCAVTTQNPDTGLPDLATLHALTAYRGIMITTEPLPFGIVGRVVKPGLVRIGDPVTVA
jgi:uncharacterized protein YcbX